MPRANASIAALPLDESALTTMQSPKAAPRVAFGTIVENGMLSRRGGAERRHGAGIARPCVPMARC